MNSQTRIDAAKNFVALTIFQETGISNNVDPPNLIGQLTNVRIVLSKVFTAGSFAQAKETKNIAAGSSVLAAKTKNLGARSFAQAKETRNIAASSFVLAAKTKNLGARSFAQMKKTKDRALGSFAQAPKTVYFVVGSSALAGHAKSIAA